jgi:hypothetical protein
LQVEVELVLLVTMVVLVMLVMAMLDQLVLVIPEMPDQAVVVLAEAAVAWRVVMLTLIMVILVILHPPVLILVEEHPIHQVVVQVVLEILDLVDHRLMDQHRAWMVELVTLVVLVMQELRRQVMMETL